MAVSSRIKETKHHPLELVIQRAHLRIKKDNFNSLLNALHEIAGKTNQDDEYSVKKNSDLYNAITRLFKLAKEKYPNPERTNEIRMKQATFLEHTGHYESALSVFDSLAKKASSPLRWAAMNSRTWLLRRMGRFQQALDSANELIALHAVLPEDQRPSRARLAAAHKLADGTKDLIRQNVEAKPSAALLPFFGSSVRHERKLSAGRDVADEGRAVVNEASIKLH